MTSRELLKCLKDRPCAVCKFRDENGCHKWTCVFEQPTDDETVIEDIKAEIDTKRIRKNPKNDFIDGYNLAMFEALEIIDKHISGKENE